jgi:hypothetical protein
MRCRPFLRVALFVALACSFGAGLGAVARADETCPAEVRHLPMAGTEAPGSYDVALIAETPRTVVAEWAAFTDHGFLTATLPPPRLDEAAGPYTAPIAFCRPVFGRYTFFASFNDN